MAFSLHPPSSWNLKIWRRQRALGGKPIENIDIDKLGPFYVIEDKAVYLRRKRIKCRAGWNGKSESKFHVFFSMEGS